MSFYLGFTAAMFSIGERALQECRVSNGAHPDNNVAFPAQIRNRRYSESKFA